MGYYTQLIVDVKIKKCRLPEFRRLVEMKKNDSSDNSRYFLEDMIISDDGDIEYDDYYGVHYGDLEFAGFIAAFTEEGSIEFIGEDGERWGYHFCGDGRIRRIEYVQTIGDFVYLKDSGIKSEVKK
jgi:hypothetical protein